MVGPAGNDSERPRLGWTLGPVAHRGLHNAARGRIENTASAIEAALAKGYAIEVDLQADRDGVPVVFHDERLERLIDADGEVADRSLAELQALSYRGSRDRILSLDELLEMVQGRVPLVIEVKTMFGEPGAYEQTIARKLAGYRGPLAVMSFDHRSVASFRTLAPLIPRGMISYRWDDGWMPHVPEAERQALRDLDWQDRVMPSFIAYDIDDLPEAAPLELCRRLGIPLFTWTVSTPAQRALAAQLADAIIFEGFEP